MQKEERKFQLNFVVLCTNISLLFGSLFLSRPTINIEYILLFNFVTDKLVSCIHVYSGVETTDIDLHHEFNF